MKDLKILFIGDIFAQVGRNLVVKNLTSLIDIHNVDFVVANGENVTHGRSLSLWHYQTLQNAGINVFTMGNHTFFLKEAISLVQEKKNIIRPANYSKLAPGRGSFVFNLKNYQIRITNLLGQTFMPQHVENPFLLLDEIVQKDESDFHFVDFHAEVTAEKIALAWAFDGKITGLLGTHTHVPTSDARLLPKWTFFVSDLGMTGPYDSIIGAKPEPIIHARRTNLPFRLIPATGRGQFCAMVLTLDVKTKKVKTYQQIYQIFA